MAPFQPCRTQGKEDTALCLIRTDPSLWCGPDGVDERDKALLFAPRVAFLDYNKGSYLRKLVCCFQLLASTR
jgi:hypothetical protein